MSVGVYVQYITIPKTSFTWSGGLCETWTFNAFDTVTQDTEYLAAGSMTWDPVWSTSKTLVPYYTKNRQTAPTVSPAYPTGTDQCWDLFYSGTPVETRCIQYTNGIVNTHIFIPKYSNEWNKWQNFLYIIHYVDANNYIATIMHGNSGKYLGAV